TRPVVMAAAVQALGERLALLARAALPGVVVLLEISSVVHGCSSDSDRGACAFGVPIASAARRSRAEASNPHAAGAFCGASDGNTICAPPAGVFESFRRQRDRAVAKPRDAGPAVAAGRLRRSGAAVGRRR